MIIEKVKLQNVSVLKDIDSDGYLMFGYLCFIDKEARMFGYSGSSLYGNKKFESVEEGISFLKENYIHLKNEYFVPTYLKMKLAEDLLWCSKVCKSKYKVG